MWRWKYWKRLLKSELFPYRIDAGKLLLIKPNNRTKTLCLDQGKIRLEDDEDSEDSEDSEDDEDDEDGEHDYLPVACVNDLEEQESSNEKKQSPC